MLSTLKNSVSWILTPFRRQTPLKSRPLLNQPKQCRICLGDEIEENKDDKLIHPCHCTGHMHYVHRNCLNTWRNYQKQQHLDDSKCDICQYTFNIHSLPLWLRILKDENFLVLSISMIGVPTFFVIRDYYVRCGFDPYPPNNTILNSVVVHFAMSYTTIGLMASSHYLINNMIGNYFNPTLNMLVTMFYGTFISAHQSNYSVYATGILGFLIGWNMNSFLRFQWERFIYTIKAKYNQVEIIEDIE